MLLPRLTLPFAPALPKVTVPPLGTRPPAQLAPVPQSLLMLPDQTVPATTWGMKAAAAITKWVAAVGYGACAEPVMVIVPPTFVLTSAPAP